MEQGEVLERIQKLLSGQGNQVDTGSVLPSVLTSIISWIGDLASLTTEAKDSLVEAINELTSTTSGAVGDMSALETDHKSDLVSAINELFDVAETDNMVISMSQTNAQRKLIYERCKEHNHLAKNIVFLSDDGMHYRVNGYKFYNNLLYLNVIFSIEDGQSTFTISSNGSIAIPN